jgi:NADH dehydrogenase FAD-containing subunit
MTTTDKNPAAVAVVGGEFGGFGCATGPAGHGVAVTLFDGRHCHQVQLSLDQVPAVALSTSDIARPQRTILHKDDAVAVKPLTETDVDPRRTVRIADRQTFGGDSHVRAVGSRPNVFHDPPPLLAQLLCTPVANRRRPGSRVWTVRA